MQDGGSRADFTYGPLGELQKLTVGGPSENRADTYFGCCLKQRTEGAQSVLNRRVAVPGASATLHGTAGPWTFAFGDGRGFRFGTDKNGTFVQNAAYQPFGEAIFKFGAAPGTTNYENNQWNGGDLLAAFGVVRLGARYYDPVIGRFLSRDPIISPKGKNPYAFASNDPVNRFDPTGLDDPDQPLPPPSERPPLTDNDLLQSTVDGMPNEIITVDGGCFTCRVGPFNAFGLPLLAQSGYNGPPGSGPHPATGQVSRTANDNGRCLICVGTSIFTGIGIGIGIGIDGLVDIGAGIEGLVGGGGEGGPPAPPGLTPPGGTPSAPPGTPPAPPGTPSAPPGTPSAPPALPGGAPPVPHPSGLPRLLVPAGIAAKDLAKNLLGQAKANLLSIPPTDRAAGLRYYVRTAIPDIINGWSATEVTNFPNLYFGAKPLGDGTVSVIGVDASGNVVDGRADPGNLFYMGWRALGLAILGGT
jgi:RHS repeat-associated protein